MTHVLFKGTVSQNIIGPSKMRNRYGAHQSFGYSIMEFSLLLLVNDLDLLRFNFSISSLLLLFY